MEIRYLAKRFANRRVTLRLATIVALVALQLLLILACVLALKQNAALRERASTFLSWAAPLVGRRVPPITGLDWTGARREVTFDRDQRPTLVYVFSVHCPHSVANWAALRSIQELSPARVRIVYIDTIDTFGALTREYLESRGIANETVLSSLDPESALAFQVRGTPQAELVDSEGRVVWGRLGEFRPVDVEEIIAAIETHQGSS